MIKRYALALIVVIGSAALLYQQAAAKEDTAQIILKKTAVSRKNVYTYTVKKGDILSAIARNIPGITEQDISNNYQLIKELNPDLADINKLNPGQLLVLPGKPLTEEKKVTVATAIPSAEAVAPTTASTISQPYTIKKGDTLIKIIYRELKIKTDIQKTLKIIKSMNPNIADVNKIYTGDIINLPGKTLFVSVPEETKSVEQEVVNLAEKTTQPEKIIEVKEKKIMSPEARIAVIKHVITQMNGTLTTTGNYYLPIPKTGQVIIDCSKIPVIEFDDKTTVFLDLENRAHNNLKKMISDNWANYYLVKVEKNDDVISILRKVINSTKGYSMTKRENPVTIGLLPPVEIAVDWMIVKTAPKQALPLMQGLRLVYENNLLLPKAVKNYAQKNGLIITEISEETGLVGKPEEIYSLPPMPVFPTTSAKDFSYALASNLGLSADKDVDIKIFDTAKDGFNLSIKADVVVKYQDKKYIIYSRNLSQQFIDTLKRAGNELIFIADNDPPKNIMEKILRSFNIPFASGNFTFSGIDKDQAPYTLNFSGTKIKTDKDLYVIDFNMDDELRGLLKEGWSANIAKY
jgi:LysM repeat protein